MLSQHWTTFTPLQLFANKHTYHDNWWDRWMIKYFNKAIARELGERKHCHGSDPTARFAVTLSAPHHQHAATSCARLLWST